MFFFCFPLSSRSPLLSCCALGSVQAHLSNKICMSIAPSVNNIKTISCCCFFFLPPFFSRLPDFEVKVIFKEEKSAPGILLILLLAAAMIRLEVRVYLPFFIPNHNILCTEVNSGSVSPTIGNKRKEEEEEEEGRVAEEEGGY